MKTVIAVACVLLSGTLAQAQTPSVSAATCERLAASLALPNTTVTSAEAVAAGAFTPPAGGANAERAAAGLPAFCRVALTITPSSDSDIRSEVWLPLSGWNGKYLQVGNGGWGGSIQYAALADSLRRGYAAASTDTGHVGSSASFAVGHPEKLIDFGYRSVHETAVQGKATAAALYGSAPRFSYFNGCSGGGRQSFMEAQRFPGDFDGIIAGAPGYDRTDVAFQTLGMIRATHETPDSYLERADFTLIHEAAMQMCDARDGLEDQLISDPVGCDFDPGALQCKSGETSACLSESQVTAAREIYSTITDPRTGEILTTGMEPGSELLWEHVAAREPHPMYISLFQHVLFPDERFNFLDISVVEHLDYAREVDGGIYAATSADLEPFINGGGRLLIYHGWADQNIPPAGSIDYYEQVVDTLGKERTEEGVALYMVPGMGHS